MIKIAAIAPYEEFGDLIKKTFQEHDEKYHKEDENSIRYELEVIQQGENIEKIELDCNVLIARGYSAYVWKNSGSYIPVIKIPVTPNEIIACLIESKKKFGNKKVAIVGTQNLIYQVDHISEIIDLEVETIILPSGQLIDKEIEKVFQKFKSNEFVIIGGKLICDYARRCEVDYVMVMSGKSAISLAISEAKRVAHISRIEEEKAQRFKTILDYTFDGIISLNKQDKITVINATCEKIFGIKAKNAMGKKIEDILPRTQFSNLICSGNTFYEEVIKHNNLPLAVNKTGIEVKNERVGSVITFQYVSKIQEFEGRLRAKSCEKGHVAKHFFCDILGRSTSIKDTIAKAKKFSRVDSNVLISGKSGTGKELFAQSIHNLSKRKNQPFVAINCAAIPENLLESELFGYVDGAFTGARKGGKQGLFELTHKGTLFLDEISEMPLKLQGRLLRVLQEKELMRLGDDKVVHVDVRIIAATNKDLYTLVDRGEFREDLYYRLDILNIQLPSLDERKEDIPILAESFIHEYERKSNLETIYITDEAKKMLQDLEWPGNIRELRNACERLVVLSESAVIDEKDVSRIFNYKIDRVNTDSNLTIESNQAVNNSTDSTVDSCSIIRREEKDKMTYEFTINDVDHLLKKGYSKTRIAEELGIHRTTLWRRLKNMK